MVHQVSGNGAKKFGEVLSPEVVLSLPAVSWIANVVNKTSAKRSRGNALFYIYN